MQYTDLPPATVAPEPPSLPTVQTSLTPYLIGARSAHTAYLETRPRVVQGQTVEDRPTAIAALQKALELRETAEALDSDHSDPAWADDRAAGYDQTQLLAWYRDILKRWLK